MLFEEKEVVPDQQKPFIVFCHHDTVKDQNGIPLPTHFSILTCQSGINEMSFEIRTNAIYCQQNGQIKFNNGYPTVKPAYLVAMIQEVLGHEDIMAVQIIKSKNQLYFVREFLRYGGPVIQFPVEQPYKSVVTASACISNINHNTFSCSHCLLMSVVRGPDLKTTL